MKQETTDLAKIANAYIEPETRANVSTLNIEWENGSVFKKRELNYKTESAFQRDLQAGKISKYTTVFIKDSKKIYKNGTYYGNSGGEPFDPNTSQLTGFTESTLINDQLEIQPTDSVNTAFGKLQKAVKDDEEVLSAAFTKLKTSIGLTENLACEFINQTILDSKSITEAIENIAKKVDNINTDNKIISRDTIVGNKYATTNNAAAFTLDKKGANAFGIGCKGDSYDNNIYSGACDLNTGEWKEEPNNILWTHKGDFFCRSVETEYTSTSTNEFSIPASNFWCKTEMEVPVAGYRYVLGWYDRGRDGYITGYGIGSYRPGYNWGSMLFEVCQYEGDNKSRKAQMELKGMNNNLWISGTLEQNSDERLKENIRPIIGEATTLIDKDIRLVQFDWKDTGKHSYGVIAQEIEQNYPELVYENKDGLKSVSYSEVLTVKIAQLENRIKQLESEIQKLNSK